MFIKILFNINNKKINIFNIKNKIKPKTIKNIKKL